MSLICVWVSDVVCLSVGVCVFAVFFFCVVCVYVLAGEERKALGVSWKKLRTLCQVKHRGRSEIPRQRRHMLRDAGTDYFTWLTPLHPTPLPHTDTHMHHVL